MRRLVGATLAVLVAAVGLAVMSVTPVQAAEIPMLCDGDLYQSRGGGAGGTQLTRLDFTLEPPQFVDIGAAATYNYNGIGFNPADGFIYGVTRANTPDAGGDGTEATAGLKVVRIHADGTISPRGRLVYPGGDPIDERFNSVVGAFLPNGNYAIMAVFNLGGGMGQVRRLMQIDVSVTPPVIVSDIEFLGQTSNDWAVNPVDQQLYAYDPDADQMIQINPATGTSALVGLPAGFDLLQGAGSVWFDAFGRFYAFGTRPDAGQQDTLISAFLDPNGVLPPTAPYIVSSGYSPVGGSDGASCPFGVKVDKVVSSSPTGVPSGPGQVATAVAGSTVTYTYRVANQTTETQTVRFTDVLGDGRTYVPGGTAIVSGAAGTVNLAGNQLVIPDLTLVSGAIATITANVQLSPSVTGTLWNQAQITETDVYLPPLVLSDDPYAPEDADATPLVVSAVADIGIVKSVLSPAGACVAGNVTLGTEIQFQLTYTNNGPSAAFDVVVQDALPAGFTFVSSSVDPTSVDGNLITWGLGTVPPGTGSIVVSAQATATDLAATNVATISTSTPQGADTNPDSSSVTCPTEAQADLSTTVSVPDTVVAGQPVTWTISVTNNGPNTAADSTVGLDLPPGFTFVEADGGDYDPATGQWSFGPLEPGETRNRQITFIAPVDPGATGTVTATSSTSTTDPNPGNNTVSDTTTVLGQADLDSDKTCAPNVITGVAFTCTLTVTNNGPSPVVDGVVTDAPGANLTFDPAASTPGAEIVGGGPQWSGISIPVGESVSFEATFLPTAGAPTTNQLCASSSLADGVPLNNCDSVDIDPLDDASIVVDKTGPASVEANGTADWTITVANEGLSPAENTIVSDTLPAGWTPLAFTPPGATYDEATNTYTWNVGTMAPGTSQIFTVSAMAPAEGQLTSNVASASTTTGERTLSDNTDEVPITVNPWVDLVITKVVTDGSLETEPATPETYTITVTNAGPSTATGVTVTDSYPPSFTYVGSSIAPASSTATSSTYALGSIAPGASTSFTVTLMAGPEPLDPAVNTAVVSTATPEPNTANNTAQVSTVVPRVSDISVQKSGPAEANAASQLSYALTVTNAGPSTAETVTVVDTLPAGFTFVSATAGGVEGPAGVVTWNLTNVAPGTLPPLMVTVQAPNEPVAGARNQVTVDSPSDDNDANDGDFSDVDIIGVADLSIVKSAEQAGAPGSDCAVYADENILYTLTVTNSGPSTAQNVVVTDVLPGGTTLVASNPGGTLDGGVLTVPLGDMAPLAQAVVTIEVTVPPAGGLLVNTASVQSLVTQDLDLADNASNAVGCPVTPVASLSIEKTGPDRVDAATEYNYTLTVTNGGPSAADNVVVTDTLPLGLTYVSDDSGGVEDPAGVVTWNLGTVPAGGEIVITLTVLAPDEPVINDSFINSVELESTTFERDETDNGDDWKVTVDPVTVTTLTKTGPDEIDAGEEFDFQITFANAGPSSHTDTYIEDVLVEDLTFVAASHGGTYDPDTRTVTWELGTVGPAEEVTVTVTVLAPAEGGQVANSATAGTRCSVDEDPDGTDPPDGPGDLDGPDGGIGPDGIGPATAALQPTLVPHCPDPTTDEPEWTTEVVAVADLEITKEAPPFVTLGDEFDYRITVVNHGPSTATDVVVVDTLPAGMTYIRDSVGAINDGSGTLTWELGDMAAGEERVIILTVDTEVGATASIQNTASVSSNELDRTPDNDTDTASTVGVAPPPPPPSSSGRLPRTGADSAGPTHVGMWLLALGVTLTALGRVRRRQQVAAI